MFAPLSLLLAFQTSPGPVFDRCVDAIGKHNALSVSIAVDGSSNGVPSRERTQLALIRPSQLKLRVDLAQSGNQAASRRTYLLRGGRFTGYDELTHQVLRRPAPRAGSLLTRLSSLVGDVGAAANMLIDPAAARTFLDGFESLPGWVVRNNGALVEASRTSTVGGKTTSTAFAFDRKTMLPKSVRLLSATTNINWTYTYGPAPKDLSLAVPASARRVTSFTERSAPPVYSDAKAKAVVEDSRRAYANLRSAAVTASFGGQVSRYWFSRASMRERQAAVDWSYNSGILTIRDLRTGKTYRGRAKRGTIIDVLARLKFTIEPRLRQYVIGRNPIDVLFGPRQRARLAGSLVVNGAPVQVVEATGTDLVVSASIRQDNKLLSSIGVTNTDSSGRALGRSEAQFTYASVNAPISAATLRTPIAKGAKVRPLPPPAKSK